MELKIDPDWLLRMAEKEDGCSISVGGHLVYRQIIKEAFASFNPKGLMIPEYYTLEYVQFLTANYEKMRSNELKVYCRRLRKKWKRYQLQKRKQ